MKLNFEFLFIIFLIGSGCDRSTFRANSSSLPSVIPSGPSEKMSRINVTSDNWADGITPATVTLTINSHDQKPVKGVTMGLSVSGSQNVLVPCTESDSEGRSVCYVYSTQDEEKVITASGSISLSASTTFLRARPAGAVYGITSAMSVQTLPTGHKISSSVGISETPTTLKDANGVVRVETSIQSSMVK